MKKRKRNECLIGSVFSPKIIPMSYFDEYERLHPFVSQVLSNIRVRVLSEIQPRLKFVYPTQHARSYCK